MYDCHPDVTEDGSEVQGRGPSAPQPVEQREEADGACTSVIACFSKVIPTVFLILFPVKTI